MAAFIYTIVLHLLVFLVRAALMYTGAVFFLMYNVLVHVWVGGMYVHVNNVCLSVHVKVWSIG